MIVFSSKVKMDKDILLKLFLKFLRPIENNSILDQINKFAEKLKFVECY